MLATDGIRVDLILVGGDIAYQADPREYAAAKVWLEHIADMSGCDRGNILVVPGNHDVSWSTCQDALVSGVQNTIATAKTWQERDELFSKQLAHSATSEALFRPLKAYNDFAAQFKCAVFPERPFWDRTYELGGGVTLWVYGLTTTFLSGSGGRDKAAGQQFLGSAQTALNPDDDVLNLVLAHHPPRWCMDSAHFAPLMDSRGRMQFFGHEHDQRCHRQPELMRFLAGATNPDTHEAPFNPGYNIVDLHVEGTGAARSVEVAARLQHYQPPPNELYVPLYDRPGVTVWKNSLPLPHIKPLFASASSPHAPLAEDKMSAAVHAALETASQPPAPQVNSPLVAQPKPNGAATDNLNYRFWQLGADAMLQIALELELITDEDLDLQLPPRYYKAMIVAAEKGLVEELAKRVAEFETQNKSA